MGIQGQFCEHCGAANEADASFCESCGQPMAASPTAAVPAPAPAAPVRRTRRTGLLVLLGVVLLGVGAAYAYRDQIGEYMDRITRGESEFDSTGALVPAPAGPDSTGSILIPPDSVPTLLIDPADTGSDDSLPVPVPIPPERLTPAPGPPPVAGGGRPPTPAPAPAPVPEPVPTLPVPQPLPSPDPPAPPAGRISSGSALSLKAQTEVCTDKARAGDRFNAVVQQDVEGVGGARVPRGTIVTFRVVQGKPSFEIAPESLALGVANYPLRASLDSVAFKRKGNSLLGALAGAAAGVAAAKAVGADTKEAVAAGAAGAAAGALVGDQLKKADGCIAKNGAIRITLREDITIPHL